MGSPGYNAASQIISETRSNTAYTWNGAFNVNRAYGVNGLNQYTTAGSAGFGYDNNGNLTSDGSWTYVYDAENRLVSATDSSGNVASLTYDPGGRLTKMAGVSLPDTWFVYDGSADVLEYSVGSSAITNRYVHGSNAAADDPLIWYAGSGVSTATRHWLHADHEGSIIALTDSNGSNPAINTYDEYGIPGSNNSTAERLAPK